MAIGKPKPYPIIEDELYDDEELIWWGQPLPGYMARRVNIFYILTNGVMIVFALGFMSVVQGVFGEAFGNFGGNSNLPAFFPLLFFLVPGIMLVTAGWQALAPLRNYVVATRTYYALTDKRAIIVKQLLSTQVRSFYDEHVEKMDVRSYGSGVGDIILATDSRTYQRSSRRRSNIQVTFDDGGMQFGPSSRTVTRYIPQGFLAISDARQVEDLVSQVFFTEESEKPKKKE